MGYPVAQPYKAARHLAVMSGMPMRYLTVMLHMTVRYLANMFENGPWGRLCSEGGVATGVARTKLAVRV